MTVNSPDSTAASTASAAFSSTVHTVGVIGLGNVAYKYGKMNNPLSYCHAAGILHAPNVRLAAVADISEPARQAFRAGWGDAFADYAEFSTFAELWAKSPCDIMVICVRGPLHFALMKEVIAAKPRHIILEKPPTCSLEDADILANLAKQAGIVITVSYSRHFHPANLHVKKLLDTGIIGAVQKIHGFADHWVLSSSSHGMDALCQFVGYKPESVWARGRFDAKNVCPDGYEREPILDVSGSLCCRICLCGYF